jgi:hypothetical protein
LLTNGLLINNKRLKVQPIDEMQVNKLLTETVNPPTPPQAGRQVD